MLTVITTARQLSTKLVETIKSTERAYVGMHVVSFARQSQMSEAEFRRQCGEREIRVIYSPNAGIAAGFNACLDETGAEAYIMVLNEGDRLSDAAKALAMIDAHPEYDAVIGRWEVEGELAGPKRALTYEHMLRHGLGFNHSACIVRKDFHARFGNYPEDYDICMDYALFLRAARNGARFGAVDETLIRGERPGVSGRIVPRTCENVRIVRPHVGLMRSCLLGAKWLINTTVAEYLLDRSRRTR